MKKVYITFGKNRVKLLFWNFVHKNRVSYYIYNENIYFKIIVSDEDWIHRKHKFFPPSGFPPRMLQAESNTFYIQSTSHFPSSSKGSI